MKHQFSKTSQEKLNKQFSNINTLSKNLLRIKKESYRFLTPYQNFSDYKISINELFWRQNNLESSGRCHRKGNECLFTKKITFRCLFITFIHRSQRFLRRECIETEHVKDLMWLTSCNINYRSMIPVHYEDFILEIF